MGCVAQFRSPHDPRWQGTQSRHHTIFFFKNCVLLAFILLVIIEAALFFAWWRKANNDSTEYAPYSFWLRIGIALVPDMLYTLTTIALVLQKPTISLKGRAWTFHPAVALTFSLVISGLYLIVCVFNPILGGWTNVEYEHMWTYYDLIYAEVGFNATLALCYVGMTVYSCIAVHRWRMEQKRPIQRYLELGESPAAAKFVA